MSSIMSSVFLTFNSSSFYKGDIPLVVNVESADIMATLVNLKREHKEITGNDLRLTFSGATEAHLLAEEIARAGISVILTSPRTYPSAWEQKRMQVALYYLFFEPTDLSWLSRLPGPPLSKYSSISALLAQGVSVSIGVIGEFAARNTRFEIAWVSSFCNCSFFFFFLL